MVLIEGGNGSVGMRGQPYGIVHAEEGAEAPERGCPAALARTPGASFCWIQLDEVDPVIRPHPVTIEPFCIERYPFPGPGTGYTSDGMTAWDAARLDELLKSGRYGPRRLCTFTEFEVAVAGLQTNRRFVYGDRASRRRCPTSANPTDEGPLVTARIGADPECRNPETGVHDYAAVMSHWVRADPEFVAHACPHPPCKASGDRLLQPGDYVVAGGTSREETRQAPLTPHTWHDHGPPVQDGCDAMGWDDQPVICADPDPRYTGPLPADLQRAEARWHALVKTARSTGRMTAVLDQGLGREVCPPDRAGG